MHCSGKIKNFLCLVILLTSLKSFAQYPYTIKINSPDPLPTTVIYDATSDKKGYIWLGTDRGLIKYNSRTFKVIPFNYTQLKSVGYINEGEDGKIWCVNFYKQIFYVENDTAKFFDIQDERLTKLSNILNISITKNSLFISSFKTILEIDINKHTIVNSIESDKNSKNSYEFSLVYNNSCINYTSNNLLTYNNANYINTSVFNEIRLATNKKVVVGVERGKRNRTAILFDGKAIEQLPNFNVPIDDNVYHLSVTDDYEFWICTQNGAYLWDYKTGNTQLLFANERVSDVVKDFQGNYWFTTLDNGIFKCPNLNCKKLNNVFKKSDNATKIIVLPNENYIAGNTKGEIISFDSNGSKIKNFITKANDEIEFLYYSPTTKLLFSDAGVFDLKNTNTNAIANIDFGKGVFEDKYGNIIIATFNRSMLSNNSFYFSDTSRFISNNSFYNSLGNTFLSNEGNVYKKAKLIRSKRAVTTVANNVGFWIGYDDDLYYYDYNGTIKIIKDENNKSIQATHLVINNDLLIVSTTTNGLFILNNEQKLIKRFTTNNGLQSNHTKKCLVYNSKLWVLTDESLDIIDLKRNTINDFFTTTGLESLTVYDFVLQPNKVLFATPNGIMEYKITKNTFTENIQITQLNAISNNKNLQNNCKLNYNANSITFELDAIHYKAPSKLFFEYRLIGVDTIWQKTLASNNEIAYKFLPSGSYTFQVFAKDVNNVFKSKLYHFSFTINKPFWQTAWFVILMLCVIILFTFLGIRYWTIRFKTKQIQKENLLQSKLTAIRSQMNPHFLYNVLNTVQGLVYGNRKTEAAEMLGNFSDLMRKTLQESDKTEIVLQDEMETLKLYLALEQKRFDKNFECKIDIDETIDIADIHIPSMFIQPFVENAIKHGLLHKEGVKNLSIGFVQQEHKLLVSIDDNGVGRKQSAIINQNKKIQSTGFAIKGIEDRMAIYNAMNKEKIEMEIVDKKQGTLVKLILPTK